MPYTILSSHTPGAGGPGGGGVNPPDGNGNQTPGGGPGGGNPWDVTIIQFTHDAYTNADMALLQWAVHTRPTNTTGFKAYIYAGTAKPTSMNQWGAAVAAAPISDSGDTILLKWVPCSQLSQVYFSDVVAYSPTYSGEPQATDFTESFTVPAIALPGQVTNMHVYGDQNDGGVDSQGNAFKNAVWSVVGGVPSAHFKFQYNVPSGSCTDPANPGSGAVYDCNYWNVHIEILKTDANYNALPGAHWVDTFGIPTLGNPVVWEQTDWFSLDSAPIYCQIRWRSQSHATGEKTEWTAYNTDVRNVMFPGSSGLDLTKANPTSAKVLSQTDLVNGSFEQQMFGWIPQIGWALTQDVVQSGTYSIKYVAGSASYAAWLQNWGAVNPGDTFACEMWEYQTGWTGDANPPYFILRCYFKGGTGSVDKLFFPGGPPGAGAWYKQVGQVTTASIANGDGGDTYSMDFYIIMTAKTGTWWVDSLRCYYAPNGAVLTGLGGTMAIQNNLLVVKDASLKLQQMLPGGMTNSTFLSSGAINDVTKFANGVLANNAIFGNAVILNANIGNMSVDKLYSGFAFFQNAYFAQGKVISSIATTGVNPHVVVANHGYTNAALNAQTIYVRGFLPPNDGLNGSWACGNPSTAVIDANTLALNGANATSPSIAGVPVIGTSIDPTVQIASAGITMWNSNLKMVNISNGGITYSLNTTVQTFDTTYGSLASQIQGINQSTGQANMSSVVSRGIVVYYGANSSSYQTMCYIGRDPSVACGQVTLYGSPSWQPSNQMTVYLDGSTGNVRAVTYSVYYTGSPATNMQVINNQGQFVGAGVLCPNNGLGAKGYNTWVPAQGVYQNGQTWTFYFSNGFVLSQNGLTYHYMYFYGGVLCNVG